MPELILTPTNRTHQSLINWANNPSSATITADSGTEIQNAFGDGGPGMYYYKSADTALPHWVKAQFSMGKIAHSYGFNVPPNSLLGPKSWQLQASNNNIDWVVLDDRSNIPLSAYRERFYCYLFTNSTSYIYYRLFITANQSGNRSYVNALYINDESTTGEFFSTSIYTNPANSWSYGTFRLGDGVKYCMPIITPNGTGYYSLLAFAGTAKNGIPAVFGFQFHTAPAYAPTYYRISRPVWGGTGTPKSWVFEGSQDTSDGMDGSWTTLDTQTNIAAGTGSLETYNFTNTVSYKAYRIRLTALGQDYSAGLGQLEICAYLPDEVLITVNQVAHGTIDPDDTTITMGQNLTLNFNADTDYACSKRIYDSSDQGAGTSLILNNIQAAHTITAEFLPLFITISEASFTLTRTKNSITLDGTYVGDYDENSTYRVRWKKDTDTVWGAWQNMTITRATKNLHYVISALEMFQNYVIEVEANDANGAL